MKRNNTVNQIIGSLYVLSLILLIVCLDRLIVLGGEITGNMWVVWGAVSSVVIGLPLLIYIKHDEKKPDKARHSWKEKVILIISNTCSGSVLDTLIVLSFIGFAAWIPDSISDFVKDGTSPLRILIYLFGLFMLVWGKPGTYVKGPQIPDEKRRLLLSGMSNVGVTPDGKVNLMPLIEPFNTYTNLDTIVILLSDTILSNIERLLSIKNTIPLSAHLQAYAQEILDMGLAGNMKLKRGEVITDRVVMALKTLLLNCIKEVYGKEGVTIIFSAPVDYNDFNASNKMCFNTLNYVIQDEGFDDAHIVVNITPGPSLIASVMAINAIKGNRAMVYVNQNAKPFEKSLLPATPDVTLIQFEGWLDERNNK